MWIVALALRRPVTIIERATSQTVTGVDHIESNSFNGIGLIKIYFKENASTALAISQLSSVSSAIRNILPQGIAPPTILDFNATNVPIIDVISTSETLTEMQLYDYMFNFVGLFLLLPGV